MLPSVMLIDGNSRASLDIARSLGRQGIPVMSGGTSAVSAAAGSRFVRRWFEHPSGDEGVERMHAAVVERVRAWRPDVLIPIFGHGWETVYAFFEEYARLTIIPPSPGPELFQRTFDKGTLAEAAAAHGMPTPATFRPTSLDEVRALSRDLPYPVLLKPRRSALGWGIKRVTAAVELTDCVSAFGDDLPLIQEYIEGEDLELTILCVQGEPLAASAYVSLRNHPLPYGPPIACRTIADESLVALGSGFLRSLGYHGVAHLDLRRDRRDGRPKLLDFNPRLAGTTAVSVRSGVDFPLMLYRLALGERVDPCFTYATGMEFRWLLYGEILHLADTPHRARTLRDLLRWGGVETNVSVTDPLPHVAEGLFLLRRLGGGLLRRAGWS